MTNATTPTAITTFDYRTASSAILKTLKRDRDRQIIARRFGFDMPARQTLEQIGASFGITRERVRQIEKTTLIKLSQQNLAETKQVAALIHNELEQQGGLASTEKIASKLGAPTPAERAYIVFLSTLAHGITVIDEDEQLRSALSQTSEYPTVKVREIINQLVEAAKTHGKPLLLKKLGEKISVRVPEAALANIASIAKQLAHHETQWGLISWPEVNPKSIRDKTYLVLTKHAKPMHFSEISEHIKTSNFARRDVTVQAVHNELIKDSRFILIGRGIYALAEWGYTAGTVADIIIEVLREEYPLHKDEIVKRVLKRRQVKTTTVILNLQEKDHFVRVAKATYKLKEQA